METEIIIHNSVSLDGSLTGFMPDMGVHYSIAGSYKHDARLIGSKQWFQERNLIRMIMALCGWSMKLKKN